MLLVIAAAVFGVAHLLSIHRAEVSYRSRLGIRLGTLCGIPN